ncbi:MAG: N-6 DNA methylase, partial [Ginsengibacter sp.]
IGTVGQHGSESTLGQFALAEGKKGGQFYTPASVVRLLVQMLEPYEGRVFDPCCGSGGMFVQSEKFIEHHRDHYKKNASIGSAGKKLSLDPADYISIYGQESNQTTWRLCKMNLAIRGIDSTNVKWNNEGSFLNDAHKDLKADYIIANPPFNDSDWSGELLRDDGRWNINGEKLVPPTGNANYAWILHFLFHLAPTGKAGFVLSKGSLTSQTNNEGEIRKALTENDLVDCIVNLPTKLFLNTQIPACLWFLTRNKTNGGFRERKNEILFIDARNLGHLVNRRNRELSADDISNIADTYHQWRNKEGKYEDVPGFCKSATLEEVSKLNYVLTPGRYVGLPEEEDDFDFTERFTTLKDELEKQMKEEIELNKMIITNLAKIDIGKN